VLSFVERHGLWSDEQKEAARRLRRTVEEKSSKSSGCRFPRSAWDFCAARRWVASEALGVAGERLLHHHDDAGQGHLAPHGISGVHIGRAVSGMREMEGAADVLMVGRSHHVPGFCRGPPESGLAVVRHLFWRRTAGAVRDPAISIDRCSINWEAAVTISSPGWKSNFHIFKLEDAKMSPEHAGQTGRATVGQPCCRTAINTSPSSATTRWSRCWKSSGAMYSRSIFRCDRSRVEFGPSQCEFTFAPTKRPVRPPTTWCCFVVP